MQRICLQQGEKTEIIGQILLKNLSSKVSTKQVLQQNYNKLIIELLCNLLLTLPFDENIGKLARDTSTAVV